MRCNKNHGYLIKNEQIPVNRGLFQATNLILKPYFQQFLMRETLDITGFLLKASPRKTNTLKTGQKSAIIKTWTSKWACRFCTTNWKKSARTRGYCWNGSSGLCREKSWSSWSGRTITRGSTEISPTSLNWCSASTCCRICMICPIWARGMESLTAVPFRIFAAWNPAIRFRTETR